MKNLLNKMKRVILVVVLSMALSCFTNAQTAPPIPPFQHVSVETIDYSGIKDMFQVSLYARRWLTIEQFHLIGDTRENWDAEIRQDSCSVMTFKLETHERISGKYHTSLYLVDCKSDTVYQSDGKAMGSSPAQGFQYAAEAALKDFKKDWEKGQEPTKKSKKRKN